MTFRRTLLTTLASIMLIAQSWQPGPAMGQTFDAGEKKAIENIVREYLLANPEILLQSMQEYRRRQELSEQNQIKRKLANLGDILTESPGSPIGGNPNGDVTIVEFFDYRCGYCKKVFPTVQKLLKDDGNIRYVFKEFPILGPVSEIATRASLAMWALNPDQYMTFHTAVMTSRGQLDEARIFKIAKKAGYDVAAVREKMNSADVNTEIGTNASLARELGITGTPAFIVGDHIVPGAVDLATLKQLVKAARN